MDSDDRRAEHRGISDVLPVPFLGKDPSMTATVFLQPAVALIAGVLILLVPRLLNYVVALYLIVIGIIGLVQVSS